MVVVGALSSSLEEGRKTRQAKRQAEEGVGREPNRRASLRSRWKRIRHGRSLLPGESRN
jgi:hypothetical protein